MRSSHRSTILRRRGGVFIYAMFAMLAMFAVISLAVDLGRVKLAEASLGSCADAAARAGAGRLLTDPQNATLAATYVAQLNSVDGQAVTLVPASDIAFGRWDEPTGTFTVNGIPTNACRVTARRIASRNNPIPTVWAGLLGRSSMDVSASATVALLTTPTPWQVTNRSNPWLAGMPAGTNANGYDSAPSASPTLLISSGLVAGAQLTFQATGATSNQGGVEAEYEPDGNLNWIIHNYPGAEHGMADLKAPISALVGVFLNDSQPNGTPAPATLDFTTATSRDFSTLSPQLKQPFFIGDAKRANGTQQKFVVPNGATRLYVGSMDGQQWSDNAGGFQVTVTSGATIYRISTVR